VTGVVFFIIGHLTGRTFWENFLFAVGIIVANVPEGLLPTVTRPSPGASAWRSGMPSSRPHVRGDAGVGHRDLHG
jgi:hypothetical protein